MCAVPQVATAQVNNVYACVLNLNLSVRIIGVGTQPTGWPSQCVSTPAPRAETPSVWAVQGPTGPMGLTGPQGPIGSIGATGASGAQGPTGPTGPPGAIGAQGPTGAIGPVGPTGPAGPIGPAGPAGAAGPQGPVGGQGPTGEQGLTGVMGPQGSQGAEGPVGPQGIPGISGYQIVSASWSTPTMQANWGWSQIVFCPTGKKIISGGFIKLGPNTDPYPFVRASGPFNSDAWYVDLYNAQPTPVTLFGNVYAICAFVQ